jgi:large subunit ribosomal protein L13
MTTVSIKTFMAKNEDVSPNWFVADGDNQIVGRFATRLATILMGKHKPCYTPHVDCGDCVIVVNVERIRFSGNTAPHPDHPYFTTKMLKKTYQRYSGYPSGQTIETAEKLWERHPDRILHEAVRRMLPKSKLGRQMLKKLKLFIGPDHTHQAQQPAELPEHLRG